MPNKNDTLKAQLADGATPEQLQAAIDSLEAIKTELNGPPAPPAAPTS